MQLSGASEASTADDAVDSQIADQEDQDNSSEEDEEDDDGREGSPALSQYPSTQAAQGGPPSRALIASTNRQNRPPTPVTPDAPEKCSFTPCVGDDEIYECTSGCKPPMKAHSACMRQSPLMEYGKLSKKVGNKKPKEFYFAENVVYCGRCLPRLIRAWVGTTDGKAYVDANRTRLQAKQVLL